MDPTRPTTLLRIDASARREGSHSRALADHFQSLWLSAHPGGRVVHRDLAVDPPPHLDQATITAFTHRDQTVSAAPCDGARLSELLIAELVAADHVLVASPLYNFGVPSPLKSWIDHVVRFGHTFNANEHGYFGLLTGKTATLITARGGDDAGRHAWDFQSAHLQAVFEFMGFTHTNLISLTGTIARGNQLPEKIAAARSAIAELDCLQPAASPRDNTQWIGHFSARDRQQINDLRRNQVAAILRADAHAYAELCTDDILLLLQGFDVASGRSAFLDRETLLLANTMFDSLCLLPLRIERQGDLAVEVGRQQSAARAGSAHAELFRADRKYTHVLRHTPAGWRFAVLMSSNNM